MNLRLLLALLFAGLLAVHASVRSDPKQIEENKKEPTHDQIQKKQLTELQQQIKLLQKKLSSIKQSKDTELNQLKNTDLKINQLVRQIYQLDQKIIQLSNNYTQLNQTITLNQEKLTEHQQVLSSQLNASYYLGQQEFIKLLLNQQNPAVFGRIMTYYQYFNRQRSLQIEAVNLIIIKLDEQGHELQLLQQEIELQQYLKNSEKSTLEQQQTQRSELISNLSKQYDDATSQIEELEKNEKQLKDLLTHLQQVSDKMALLKEIETKQEQARQEQAIQQDRQKNLKPHKLFAKLKRKLKWPSKGKLRILYGHWRSVDKVKWHGNIILSQEGSNVYSISHGTVVYSDWLRGYGLLTIIDHGKGYMSLYGYSQAILKSVGDQVEEGDIIATSGRTSGRSEAGIYFEIRYNGIPTNPDRWCSTMPKT